ncbi:helix-turn-helix domain-containing protein [Brachybacterium sp. DNPG3]
MPQDSASVDGLVRKRIRGLRLAQGLSLDDLAARTHMSPSTLSRIENGQRRLALDQLVLIARALDTGLDQLVESAEEDVVSSAVIDEANESKRWSIRAEPDKIIMRRRLTGPPPEPSRMRAHPGKEWLLVLSGTAILRLGERRYRIETDQCAEFSTMLPHAFGAEGGPCEVLMVFDRAASREHQGHHEEQGEPSGRDEREPTSRS